MCGQKQSELEIVAAVSPRSAKSSSSFDLFPHQSPVVATRWPCLPQNFLPLSHRLCQAPCYFYKAQKPGCSSLCWTYCPLHPCESTHQGVSHSVYSCRLVMRDAGVLILALDVLFASSTIVLWHLSPRQCEIRTHNGSHFRPPRSFQHFYF